MSLSRPHISVWFQFCYIIVLLIVAQMFAVSYVAAVSTEDGDVVRVRRIRVFGRECNLLSTSERTDGLEQCLAWRPGGGSLIASTQRLPNKHQVCTKTVT